MSTSTKQPIHEAITPVQLMEQLRLLGVQEGMVLEAHTALSAFGYVVGGAQAVVDSYLSCLGYDGTLAMPMQDANNCDPTIWEDPPIDHQLHQLVRDYTPAFDRRASDGVEMGSVADNFRRREGTVVSNNPSLAYAAWGKYARLICGRQPLHFSLGEESPTARLYELNGYVLLAGVPYRKCTCMHLAEYRSQYRPIVLQAGAVELNGKRVWKKYLDVDLNSEIFNEIGVELEKNVPVQKRMIGKAECRLLSIRDAVDFATAYLKQK